MNADVERTVKENSEIKEQSKAKIFLADERGCDETDWYRRYSTFNYENYFNAHKHAFGNVSVLNDETLAGGRLLNINIQQSHIVLLLPVVGAVCYNDTLGNENTIHARQLHVSYLPAGAAFEISNPFKDELINVIQLWIKTDMLKTNIQATLFNFDINRNINNFSEIISEETIVEKSISALAIGKFAGRKEAVYKMKHKQGSLFVFIIQGAFEVQGRLLHARDGLALWEISEDIELEALSNDAIVLITELC